MTKKQLKAEAQKLKAKMQTGNRSSVQDYRVISGW